MSELISGVIACDQVKHHDNYRSYRVQRQESKVTAVGSQTVYDDTGSLMYIHCKGQTIDVKC